jgi:hypothetical protein
MKNGEPNQKQADTNPGAQGAPKNPLPAQPATEQQLRATEQKIEEQIEERMTGFERSMVRLTRYGLTVTILTGFIFAGQLYEMITGGTQTDKLVGYAQKQATAADDMSQASKDFTDSTYWMEQHMDDAANAIQDSVDTADRNTRATIRNSQTALHLDQRAWVGMGHMEVEPGQVITANTEVTFAAYMGNSGKTPAFTVKPTIHWKGLRPGDPLVGPPLSTPQGHVVLFPSNPLLIKTTSLKFTAEELELLKGGTVTFKVWGEITYEDINRRPHWTHFCVFLEKDLRNLSACDRYNETDDKPN